MTKTSTITFRTVDGRLGAIDDSALGELAGQLPSGALLRPGDPEYDPARAIWNAMVDRRPALIARCRSAREVAAVAAFAARHDLALSVRGGGHNIGGRALLEDALLIDCSQWRTVRVDPSTGRVEVAPGATLGDLDRATAEHGLVVPSGIVSETGVAGLTLGGGFGWLSRRWGLTCDHLVGAEIVTADGALLDVDESSHPELLWALRGGGQGFVIVTSFRFQARPLADAVQAGPIFESGPAMAAAARRFRDASAAAPEHLGSLLRLGIAPPAPFLPSEVHGKPVAVTILCHSGPGDTAERELAPFMPPPEGPAPLANLIQSRAFPAFQAMFDPGEPKGRRNYWKSEYLGDLDDQILDLLVDAAERFPAPAANIKLFSLGGAVTRVPGEATAAGHRDAKAIAVIATAWEDPSRDEANVSWVRETWQRVHNRSGRGGYVNFLTADRTAEETLETLGGVDLARLARIREQWDPRGVLGRLL